MLTTTQWGSQSAKNDKQLQRSSLFATAKYDDP